MAAVPDARRGVGRHVRRLPAARARTGRDRAARRRTASSPDRLRFVLNLWFWPFGTTGTGAGAAVTFVPGGAVLDNLRRWLAFSTTTSLGFDIPRGLATAIALLLVGRPVLLALRRAARRAAFDAPCPSSRPRADGRVDRRQLTPVRTSTGPTARPGQPSVTGSPATPTRPARVARRVVAGACARRAAAGARALVVGGDTERRSCRPPPTAAVRRLAHVDGTRRRSRPGRRIADDEIDGGADLLVVGRAGGADAAVAVSVLTNTEPVKVLARGAAATDPDAWMERAVAVRDARRACMTVRADPDRLLAEIGSARLAVVGGLVLRAAARRTPVLLDGPVAAAAALIAYEAQPRAVRWWAAADLGTDPLHELALTRMGQQAGARPRDAASATDSPGCSPSRSSVPQPLGGARLGRWWHGASGGADTGRPERRRGRRPSRRRRCCRTRARRQRGGHLGRARRSGLDVAAAGHRRRPVRPRPDLPARRAGRVLASSSRCS